MGQGVQQNNKPVAPAPSSVPDSDLDAVFLEGLERQRGEHLPAPPSSFRLPRFTPFVVAAVVLVGIWLALFLTAPKNTKPQHLHICETGGPESHKALCLH